MCSPGCGRDSTPGAAPRIGLALGSGLSRFGHPQGLANLALSGPAQVPCSPLCVLVGAAFSKGENPFLKGKPLLMFLEAGVEILLLSQVLSRSCCYQAGLWAVACLSLPTPVLGFEGVHAVILLIVLF